MFHESYPQASWRIDGFKSSDSVVENARTKLSRVGIARAYHIIAIGPSRITQV